jgi:lysophospholipase L1-like esterase
MTAQISPSPCSTRSSRPISVSRAAGPWIPLLLTPFAFGAVIKIFPIENALALGAVIFLLGTLPLLQIATFSDRRMLPYVASIAVLLCCLSLPFWSLQSSAIIPQPAKPIYSYSEAKANPEAFARWWSFFRTEVFRAYEVIHMPDPLGRLPHVLRPGVSTRFVDGSISINDLGYRGENFQREKGETFRIIAIGASPTFGQTLFRDSRPWPAVLDDLIQQRLRCRRPVQVINGGVNAYVLKHAIERLERDQTWLGPDMILSYFGWNDRLDMGVNPKWLPTPVQKPPEAPPSEATRTRLVLWLLERTGRSLFETAKATVARGVAVFETMDRAQIMVEVRASELYRQYQRLVGHAQRNGASVVLLSVNTAVLPDSPGAARAFYRPIFFDVDSALELMKYHNVMLQELARNNPHVHFADTSKNLSGHFDDGLYLDVVHFTTAGDALMANNVYREIEPLLTAERTLGCERK